MVWSRAHWLQDGFFLDFLHALLQGQPGANFPPLAGMPHVGHVEFPLADKFQAGEGSLEGRRDRCWARAAKRGDEVEKGTMPFRVDVDDVVPARLLRRLLNKVQLQERLDQ